MKHALIFIVLLSSAALSLPAIAQGPDDKYVSREEYDKLKAELNEMKQQMKEVLASRAAPPPK